ncbi:hypothetical protein, partial [Flagellimonas baculiformis]|uniref:hypothetical protein n=1 Tax=Flagellimonas baculiformis TaxID=3067310 RepID=UPI00296F454F
MDGTPVSTWYDIVYFSEQNAIPNPLPANYPLSPLGTPSGFDYNQPNSGPYALYLTPTGSIPGLPILRRNSTDNINFNPVVQFNGSGDGQALHFRMVNRNDITVFVVFKALGAGNSAETQRLLFGGDVDIQHDSFNPSNWKTNLSLGVSDGNNFSIGRTWKGDGGIGYFASGNINLLGEPAIGTFVRAAAIGSETLTTYANGILDIFQVRNHALAGNELFEFHRLGKHFNSNDSNRNLTGDIAEILVADVALDANAIQKVESYLAIKYGITLNTGGALGSINGNDGYNYIAADGTIIWQVDPTYKHDIAGIGKDRYRDNNVNPAVPDLRFNQDQRISKSVNADAIVTISTNNNFSSDNIDLSRNQIDGSSPFDYYHNYLIWGNNNATINEIVSELPIGINSRIGREWRTQAVRSVGATAISNVSVRIDLSGSDILNNGDCGLKLLIDTDEDGDFTTGPITMIDVTSVDMAGNAYFDNVNFEHRDVFTVGFGDTEPPTATDPDPITVCDNVPVPDASVVDDEDDNCAVDTVEHLADTSDGLSNPETISRTYRVTDTSGNFVDVTQTIYVYISPDIDDILDQEVCDSYILPAITGSNLTGNEAYYSGSGGTGTQFAPGDNISLSGTYYIYDETGTTPNCFDEETFTVTVNVSPVAPIANNLTFCYTDSPTGADLVPAISATITWYSDAGLTSVVAPDDPLLSQDYHVTQTINGCEGPATTITVTINSTPPVPTITVTPEDCSSPATNVVDNHDANLAYTSIPAGLSVDASGNITGGTDGTDYVITATNPQG